MKINPLTTSEEQLMTILWKLDSAYARDISAHYPDPKPHPNTISTFLKILVEKNFLTTEKEGRIFKYSVAVPYVNYRNFVVQNIINTYFSGSAIVLLKNLLAENLIKTKDLTQFFEIKTTLGPIADVQESQSTLSEFITEITSKKKSTKKGKKKNKKKNK